MNFKITEKDKPIDHSRLVVYIEDADIFDVAVFYPDMNVFKTHYGRQYTISQISLWAEIDCSHQLIMKGDLHDQGNFTKSTGERENQDREKGETDPDKE